MRIRWLSLPVLLLPLYSITSSLEACSSPTSVGGVGAQTSALTCQAGETARKINQADVCCVGNPDGTNLCRGSGNYVGGACSAVGATATATILTASFDVCVEESCRGDRECTEFPYDVDEETIAVVCTQQADGSLLWSRSGSSSHHRVQRACLVARTEVCHGPGYSSTNPATYGYSSAEFYGYGELCGYGAGGYSGPPSVSVRKLYLMSSTCTAPGGTPQPCPVGAL